MSSKTALKWVFSCIFLALALCTGWASTRQSVLLWGGLTSGQDRYWTIATMLDAYCGFLTFYMWVLYKERSGWSRVVWFIAIMLLGNMAMSTYVLLQLWRLRPEEEASRILLARNP